MNISDLLLNNSPASYARKTIEDYPDYLGLNLIYEAKRGFFKELFIYIIEIKGGKYMEDGKIRIIDQDKRKDMVYDMNTHIKHRVENFYKMVIE